MRYRDSIFASLLKPISRRWFKGMATAHGGDAYDKTFTTWPHGAAFDQAIDTGLGKIVLPAPYRGLRSSDLTHDRRDPMTVPVISTILARLTIF